MHYIAPRLRSGHAIELSAQKARRKSSFRAWFASFLLASGIAACGDVPQAGLGDATQLRQTQALEIEDPAVTLTKDLPIIEQSFANEVLRTWAAQSIMERTFVLKSWGDKPIFIGSGFDIPIRFEASIHYPVVRQLDPVLITQLEVYATRRSYRPSQCDTTLAAKCDLAAAEYPAEHVGYVSVGRLTGSVELDSAQGSWPFAAEGEKQICQIFHQTSDACLDPIEDGAKCDYEVRDDILVLNELIHCPRWDDQSQPRCYSDGAQPNLGSALNRIESYIREQTRKQSES